MVVVGICALTCAYPLGVESGSGPRRKLPRTFQGLSDVGAAWTAGVIAVLRAVADLHRCGHLGPIDASPRAALLAGRPNDQGDQSTTKASWDQVVIPGQAVGLHAVEIPNGSLCRAQVDLWIPRRGWLSTLLASVVAITAVMASVAYHAHRFGEPEQWTVAQVTNIVLLLVTVTAGAATYVAQHHAGDVVSRMVSGLRFLGTAALVIPSMAVILLVYLRDGLADDTYRPLIMGLLVILTLLCVIAAFSLARAWQLTRRDEQRRGRPSPWDRSRIDAPVVRPPARGWGRFRMFAGPGGRRTTDEVPDEPLELQDASFDSLVGELGFGERAIGVASAEGWHEVYGGTTANRRPHWQCWAESTTLRPTQHTARAATWLGTDSGTARNRTSDSRLAISSRSWTTRRCPAQRQPAAT